MTQKQVQSNRRNAIIKALKELGRLVVLGIPALAIQLISNNPADALQYGGSTLFVLRALDKYIHENKNLNSDGLLPF